MTENQARRAKMLIEKLDDIKRLPDKIQSHYRKAVNNNDQDSIEKLANIAHELSAELLRYIERDIEAI